MCREIIGAPALRLMLTRNGLVQFTWKFSQSRIEDVSKVRLFQVASLPESCPYRLSFWGKETFYVF